MNKSYSEMSRLRTLKERYDYLKIGGAVGASTFGGRRKLNQDFYRTKEWRDLRNFIITRDHGCELGVDGYEILGRIFVHHMNPITPEDLITKNDKCWDPENLVIVSYDLHAAIHYGDESLLPEDPVVRFPNDTCPWKL